MSLPKTYVIPEEIRRELKDPLGRLIPDAKVTREELERIFEDRLDSTNTDRYLFVCVGDRTTERFVEFEIDPSLEVVDSQEKRVSRSMPLLRKRNRIVLKTKNPAGVLTDIALGDLRKCLDLIERGEMVRLEVSGEEDLLTLPIVAFFPENTVTFYGQPNEGLVVVDSAECRKKATSILCRIGIKSL